MAWESTGCDVTALELSRAPLSAAWVQAHSQLFHRPWENGDHDVEVASDSHVHSLLDAYLLVLSQLAQSPGYLTPEAGRPLRMRNAPIAASRSAVQSWGYS